MDKVLSTRLSPEAITTLEAASRRLGMTKKRFLEEAIQLRADQPDQKQAERDREIAEFEEALKASFGSLRREESPEEQIESVRREWDEEWDRREKYFDSLRLPDS